MIKLSSIGFGKIESFVKTFESEAEFIAWTIEYAKKQNGGDEYEEMTSNGFEEVVDKVTYDEDGEIDEFESHWVGNYTVCLYYWKHANPYIPGEHWLVSKK